MVYDMALCTLADVKSFIGIPTADTEHDTLLNTLIDAVADRLAREAGRVAEAEPCLERTDLVEYHSVAPRTQVIWLSAYPVTAITEIKEALYGDYASATALTENDDYQCNTPIGGLYRIGTWLAGDLTVKVDYTGGYTVADDWVSGEGYALDDRVLYNGAVYRCKSAIDPSETAPPDDTDHFEAKAAERRLPDDIRQAAVMQTAFWFQRRKSLGLVSEGVQGGSISSYARDELLLEVRQVMRKYRRMV
jgi:hypothetical protein